MIIKLSVFKNIDWSNIYNFIESMKCVYSILVSARLKIKLNSSSKLYFILSSIFVLLIYLASEGN